MQGAPRLRLGLERGRRLFNRQISRLAARVRPRNHRRGNPADCGFSVGLAASGAYFPRHLQRRLVFLRGSRLPGDSLDSLPCLGGRGSDHGSMAPSRPARSNHSGPESSETRMGTSIVDFENLSRLVRHTPESSYRNLIN